MSGPGEQLGITVGVGKSAGVAHIDVEHAFVLEQGMRMPLREPRPQWNLTARRRTPVTDTLEHDDGVEDQSEEQSTHIEPTAVDVEAEVAMIHDLVYKAHPDVVQELLVGETLTDILASVEPARAAYQRIAEQVERDIQRQRRPGTPLVAEAGISRVLDPATLTTTQRLRLGLQDRAGKTS